MWFYLIEKGVYKNVYKMCDVGIFTGMTALLLNTDIGNLKGALSEGVYDIKSGVLSGWGS